MRLCAWLFNAPLFSVCIPQVYGDASIIFPLIISQTFAKHWEAPAEAPQQLDVQANGGAP